MSKAKEHVMIELKELRNKVKLSEFDDIFGYGGNMGFIYPIQQEPLIKVIESTPSYVEEIIVFGSSVTPYCSITSDLDLIVIGPMDKQWDAIELMKSCDYTIPKDILYMDREEYNECLMEFNSVCQESYIRGITIYKK